MQRELMEKPPLLLASGSSARRSILAAAGLDFTWRAAPVDEALYKTRARAIGQDADAVALALAEAKAAAVGGIPGVSRTSLIIGADQMLSCEGRWFDKPADIEGARNQLRDLRGRTHRLHSSVTLWHDGEVIWRHVAHAFMTMRTFSDAFLEGYLEQEADACLSCVGGYRVEGPGIQLFEAVTGDQSAILGLPMLPLLGALRRYGVIGV
ncbi:septum formation inhibitor nucleotide-binding protein Maf [Acetobacter nitrogenifigens DSM 23921 = NBRC 105050]|uniref:Nucleoside triphosphate pyrophosphatase n=1 Tax=Acetobacter nitrogenifigens DSM 23921 = NBRC 105050 TaxID=1120919 RepID=A0A511X986_9PROT|nr:Maf family protein [Acetobacter nitrogenifigens]GBQ86934.1 septum formation inhibitor nucleotide-binding protein Maf [Acetobacter nitrogenifigens DSM 23921 = NBRC 105050]GEN59481.1 Maf-like protein [Acetobacter nitrogenifigens DSM 23921 = NBRC 105050]